MVLLKPWDVLEKDLIAAMREVDKDALRQRDAEVSQRLVRIRAET